MARASDRTIVVSAYALVATLVTLAVLAAPADAEGQVNLTIEAVEDGCAGGAPYCLQVTEGPLDGLPAGTNLTIHYLNQGINAHDLHIAPLDDADESTRDTSAAVAYGQTPRIGPGEDAWLNVTIPEPAGFYLWCDNSGHEAGGMWLEAAPPSPVARFSLNITDRTVRANGTASTSPGANITTYAWDWGDGTNATGPLAEHTYGQDGTYRISLTITDEHGATASAIRAINVDTNQEPRAAFTAAVTGYDVRTDAGESADPDGSIALYRWDWGDGTSSSGRIANHHYEVADSYTITLTVTDDQGGTAIATRAVKVPGNRPPEAEFTLRIQDFTVHVDASGSMDPDGPIQRYEWDWGDGSISTGQVNKHAYADAGNYTITLTVTGDEGLTATTTGPVWLRDRDRGPTAAFTITTDLLNVTADASGSFDPDGEIMEYRWQWGEGSESTGRIAKHTYDERGKYPVRLTVVGPDGREDSTSEWVTVYETPPKGLKATLDELGVPGITPLQVLALLGAAGVLRHRPGRPER